MTQTKVPANPPMTRDRFAEYVRHLAGMPRLGHWVIKMADDNPSDRDSWASVVCWYGRNGVTLRASDDLLKESVENLRYAAVHELMHCHFAHPNKLAEKQLHGRDEDAWQLANEYAVDAVSAAVAEFLPLPSEVFASGGQKTAKKAVKTAKKPSKTSKTR